jgi:hypothetical protein
MYIDKVPNRNSRPAYLLREAWRENGKVCKRTIANLIPIRNHIDFNIQSHPTMDWRTSGFSSIRFKPRAA